MRWYIGFHLRSLREEDEALQSRSPPAPERHRKVGRWIEEKTVALQVQQEGGG